MSVKLQKILDHTATRIIDSKADTLKTFTDEELKNEVLIMKYGCDGTKGFE